MGRVALLLGQPGFGGGVKLGFFDHIDRSHVVLTQKLGGRRGVAGDGGVEDSPVLGFDVPGLGAFVRSGPEAVKGGSLAKVAAKSCSKGTGQASSNFA